MQSANAMRAIRISKWSDRARSMAGYLRGDIRLLLGVTIWGLVLIFISVPPLFVPMEPIEQHLFERLTPPAWLSGGTWEYPLGTDQLGRDVLSRLIMGTRISLMIGVGAVLLSATFGVIVGMVSGYFGGRIDALIQRIAEIQMVFPFIIVALVVMAFIQATPGRLVVVFGITGWVVYGRIIRGVSLVVRSREFVESAVGLGASHLHIIRHHIFPNIMFTAIVLASLELSSMVFAEAALSFLGIGLQPPTPSLGVMLGKGRVYVSSAWWLSTFPGLTLMVITLGANFLGDGLRNIDPRLGETSH